ncbi:unnamed protein product [Sphagnum tenellum]
MDKNAQDAWFWRPKPTLPEQKEGAANLAVLPERPSLPGRRGTRGQAPPVLRRRQPRVRTTVHGSGLGPSAAKVIKTHTPTTKRRRARPGRRPRERRFPDTRTTRTRTPESPHLPAPTVQRRSPRRACEPPAATGCRSRGTAGRRTRWRGAPRAQLCGGRSQLRRRAHAVPGESHEGVGRSASRFVRKCHVHTFRNKLSR